MARRKSGRRYTAEQKAEVIRRVQGGETQAAVAKEAAISAWTVGQWVRGAKGGVKAGRKPGRPRGSRSGRPSAVKALAAEFCRSPPRWWVAARKVLAEIERELER